MNKCLSAILVSAFLFLVVDMLFLKSFIFIEPESNVSVNNQVQPVIPKKANNSNSNNSNSNNGWNSRCSGSCSIEDHPGRRKNMNRWHDVPNKRRMEFSNKNATKTNNYYDRSHKQQALVPPGGYARKDPLQHYSPICDKCKYSTVKRKEIKQAPNAYPPNGTVQPFDPFYANPDYVQVCEKPSDPIRCSLVPQ